MDATSLILFNADKHVQILPAWLINVQQTRLDVLMELAKQTKHCVRTSMDVLYNRHSTVRLINNVRNLCILLKGRVQSAHQVSNAMHSSAKTGLVDQIEIVALRLVNVLSPALMMDDV